MKPILVLAFALGCGHATSQPPALANTAQVPVRASDAAAPEPPGLTITGVEIAGKTVLLTVAAGTSDGLGRTSTARLRSRGGQDLGEVIIIRVDKHESRWRSAADAGEARNAEIVLGP